MFLEDAIFKETQSANGEKVEEKEISESKSDRNEPEAAAVTETQEPSQSESVNTSVE